MARATAAAAFSALLLAAPVGSSAALAAAPQPAKPVDPSAYVGRWYEVARIHNKLQLDCEAATMDFAAVSAERFTVTQTCRRGSPSGPAKSWRGSGQVTDERTKAKLKVTYFGFVTKEYWVVDHAADNSWAMLATPDGRFLWLLSRRPTLPGRTEVLAHAKGLGFDLSRIEYAQQPPA